MNTRIGTTEKLSAAELAALVGSKPQAEFSERRTDPRYPFFALVTLRSLETSGVQVTACSREISSGGIGLLHHLPLKNGSIHEMSLEQRPIQLRRRVRVVWCREAIYGWFLSGAQFVSAD